jgi:hypothetical protein
MNDDFDRAAWLLRSGWYTREAGYGVRWYYKDKRGSTLETNFDEACKVQKRRDAANKGRATTGPTLVERALRADADARAAYARGREVERANCIEDVRAEVRDCGCSMRIEDRITKGNPP